MCGGGYGEGDSNNDGKEGGFLDFFRDITDGGGPGRSGARFSSGNTGGLDQNQDNYISEQEYQRGEKAADVNKREGIGDGRVGDAYNQAQTGISTFSNKFGALPRGSIITEAALGPQYGTNISTTGLPNFLQGGGFTGAAVRGIGDLIGGAQDMVMQPIQQFMPQSNQEIDPLVADAAAVNSGSSILNRNRGDISPDVLKAAMAAKLRLNPQLRNRPAPNADSPYYDNEDNIESRVVIGSDVKVTYKNNQVSTVPIAEYKKRFNL
tara:strand:- start:2 stop:796 length:795 start_codon:yes stop_codon:yes gene_type:complete